MGFNSKKFMKAKFVPRIEKVPVPDLAEFFSGLKDDVIPTWTVRGLTGNELGNCAEAAGRNSNVAAIVEGIAGTAKKEKIKAVQGLLGVSDNVPQDVAKRIEHFVSGSVSPKVDKEFAVKFCKNFPVEFLQLTNKIMLLTGQGRVPGKPQGSGKKKT